MAVEIERLAVPFPVRAVEEDRVLRLKGVFDIPAAWRLRESLAQLPPGAEVQVDFSALRECHDFALAALAQAVMAMKGLKLDARGLGQHQARLLGYLGVREVHERSRGDVE